MMFYCEFVLLNYLHGGTSHFMGYLHLIVIVVDEWNYGECYSVIGGDSLLTLYGIVYGREGSKMRYCLSCGWPMWTHFVLPGNK